MSKMTQPGHQFKVLLEGTEQCCPSTATTMLMRRIARWTEAGGKAQEQRAATLLQYHTHVIVYSLCAHLCNYDLGKLNFKHIVLLSVVSKFIEL